MCGLVRFGNGSADCLLRIERLMRNVQRVVQRRVHDYSTISTVLISMFNCVTKLSPNLQVIIYFMCQASSIKSNSCQMKLLIGHNVKSLYNAIRYNMNINTLCDTNESEAQYNALRAIESCRKADCVLIVYWLINQSINKTRQYVIDRSRLSATLTWSSVAYRSRMKVDTLLSSVTWRWIWSTSCLTSRYVTDLIKRSQCV